ncbi:hypothetical protein SCP_1402480 [Sparassis crispa]|uniref:Uncharacterized protein n=1 Tax=Sparassis crispa TaxID=139825 RepID=A0A401H3A8_9APHY|nr:hypothetical protein SCP_1402480 [Sparassis crispa]GBE88840.1 hypothetical protein SCP_1402480 [Sparassis crispa]
MTSHLADDQLRSQITASICKDLHHASNSDEVKDITNFHDWKAKLIQIDTACMHERTRILCITNSCPKQAPSFTSSSSAAPMKPHAHLPPLTNEECKLLKDNDGCFKCRTFFVPKKHCTDTCNNDYPNPATYHTLTESDLSTVRHNKENAVQMGNTSRPVTAITVDEDNHVAYNVAAVNLDSPPLAATSSILGTDSKSEGSEYIIATTCHTPHSLI